MKAAPRVGDSYRQEYYEGGAEDIGAVVDSGLTIMVAGTEYSNCLKTRDWNPLEPGPPEYKYYAPDIGELSVVIIKLRRNILKLKFATFNS